MTQTLRIAMWSGPRNISTAMLRAFGNRADTAVMDEPFYAHYLKATGLPHPGAGEVIAHHDSDWQSVLRSMLGPVPGGRRVSYQKHMTHHLLPGMARDWFPAMRHAFLIRRPQDVVRSYARERPDVNFADLGFAEQAALYEEVAAITGRRPPVLDADDVLAEPARLLAALCAALELPFDPAMLAWPAGPRKSDGVWGKHWYAGVWRSTGFQPPALAGEPLPPPLAALAEQAMPHYRRLYDKRLRG
ncbi:MAG: HAD family hydrolase [Alphaproteobacteria bacterium]|nr:HAD family hydrolase [Alphaproteobacteria bacterium]